MSEIGLGSASPKTSPSSTSAGNINQMLLTGSLPGGSNPLQQTAQQQLEQQLVTGSTTSQILDAQRQAAATLSAANSGLVTINTSVAPLNDSLVANTTAVQAGSALVSSGISSLTTAMTAAQKAQQDAVSAALQTVNQQIQDLPNQIAQAQQQFNQAIQNEKDWTNSVMPYLNANPNVNMGDMAGFDSIVQGVRDAQAKLQQLQSVGPQLQQQAQNIMAGAATQGILDVSSTGVQSLLSSMGMDSASGIGSVIASALGSYGSAGGAGITQQQLQQFANTGDYGIFSGAESSGEVYDKGIITTYSQEATDPNTRAQLYYNTLKGEGFSSSEASTYTQSQYKGATFTAAAAGLEGVLSTPTMILAGEAGPEQVSITPLSRGGGRGGSPVNITITVQGSIISDNDFKNKLNTSLKQMLREVGFT
ncbi:MAG TPA: hypothetical protein VJ792_04300, partial [Candidatus Nitrosotalea sp.]|nr:hypothetical protein [Candidatus Nitrosotalea sp.]